MLVHFFPYFIVKNFRSEGYERILQLHKKRKQLPKFYRILQFIWYKIPRIMIKDSYSREDLKSPGVYLLFGENEEGKGLVYIGEAETMIDRLKQHISQKEFWSEVIIFISKDENLNKAHIKYLENRLYELTLKVNHYKLENVSKPSKCSISESEIAEMEEFVENIKLYQINHKIQ